MVAWRREQCGLLLSSPGNLRAKGGCELPDKIMLKYNVYGSVHRKNILMYVQQDATLHSLFYVETALHVSGGITTHHQERKQLYLQHLVIQDAVDTVVCAPDDGWWYHPKHVEQFPHKINCVTLHLVGHTLERSYPN